MKRNTVIYLAALFALATAGILAYAVSHPCDCAEPALIIEGPVEVPENEI